MEINELTANSNSQRTRYVFMIAFVAAVGGFLFGFDLSLISGANIYLKDQFSLSDKMFGFTTASAALGCIAGPLLGAWLCDGIGRRNTLIFASALLGISAFMTAIPKDIFTFNVFRIVGGIGVGLCSIGSPMYIAEVSPARKRGALGIMYQLAIVVGAVFSIFICWILAKMLPDDTSWRWMFASELFAVAPFVIFLYFLPKSPRWLAEKNREEEALQVLAKIDGPEYAQAELLEIRNSLSTEKSTFAELFAPGIRIALLIGILLAFFNNWTGWSGLGGYIPYLFQRAGVSDRADAILQGVIAYGVMGVFTTAACFLVDRFGRKPLWLFASSLMIFATALVGIVFHFDITSPILILMAISLCAIPHALALGPIPWLMMSEIFPTRLRAKAVAITTTFLWCTVFSVAYLFPVIASYSEKNLPIYNAPAMTAATIALHDTNPDTITDSGNGFKTARFQSGQKINISGASDQNNNKTFTIAEVSAGTITLSEKDILTNEASGKQIKLHVGSVALAFWLYSAICVSAVIFGLKLLPETKGKTLEQIAQWWKKQN